MAKEPWTQKMLRDPAIQEELLKQGAEAESRVLILTDQLADLRHDERGLYRKISEVKIELAAAKALQEEQEQIVLETGPITCRVGKCHERYDGCLYCARDALADKVKKLLWLQDQFIKLINEAKIELCQKGDE